MKAARPLAVLVGALGGQGGGVLAEWLVAAATHAGLVAQGTSIPGVAQRTGATTYYVEVFPVPRAALAGRQPVLGLYPVPGDVDLVIASELLEALRLVTAGLVSPERTTLVTSTARALTTIERMVPGDGRLDGAALLAVARAQAQRLVAFDMDATARGAGAVVSAVMLGAIAGSRVLPIPRDVFEGVMRASGVGGDASLRGFAAGLAAVEAASAAANALHAAGSGVIADDQDAASGAALARAAVADDILALGAARVAEYQDDAYVELYRARLQQVRDAEARADPRGRQGGALVRETARFLALWMAFDDVVRVAALKVRAARFARVRAEVRAGERDVVRIVDYFKPGVAELAGLLPPRLARRLVAWERARRARGREPFALPLKLRADGIAGFLALRALSSLRGWRRRGARYAQEQDAIEQWLGAVIAGTDASWRVGYELALCGRLIKGYGATNERGKANLAHIVAHLAAGEGDDDARATAICEAREAALADEGGKALDAALARHGAPARPIVARPIVWQRKREQRRAEAAHGD